MAKDDRIDLLRKALVELKAKAPEQGRAQVDVESLEKWIAALPATDDSRAFDEWKTLAPLQHATRLESFKSTLEAGQTALKTLLAMNGGASVALLAFLGNLITKGTTAQVRPLSVAMLTFVGGAGLVGVSTAARYLTQALGSEGHTKAARRMNTYGAVCSDLLSLAAFFLGGWLSYLALIR